MISVLDTVAHFILGTPFLFAIGLFAIVNWVYVLAKKKVSLFIFTRYDIAVFMSMLAVMMTFEIVTSYAPLEFSVLYSRFARLMFYLGFAHVSGRLSGAWGWLFKQLGRIA
jgi:hypothetical protein